MKNLLFGLALFASFSSYSASEQIDCGKVYLIAEQDVLMQQLRDANIDFTTMYHNEIIPWLYDDESIKNDLLIVSNYYCHGRLAQSLFGDVYHKDSDIQEMKLRLYQNKGIENGKTLYHEFDKDSWALKNFCDGWSSRKEKKWAKKLIKVIQKTCTNY